MARSADDDRAEVIAAVKYFISALVKRNDDVLEDVFARSRCEKQDVYRVMAEYCPALALPPRDAYEDVKIYEIDGRPRLFAIDADLWDEAGKRTDLILQLTIELCDNAALIEIDDVRVM